MKSMFGSEAYKACCNAVSVLVCNSLPAATDDEIIGQEEDSNFLGRDPDLADMKDKQQFEEFKYPRKIKKMMYLK